VYSLSDAKFNNESGVLSPNSSFNKKVSFHDSVYDNQKVEKPGHTKYVFKCSGAVYVGEWMGKLRHG